MIVYEAPVDIVLKEEPKIKTVFDIDNAFVCPVVVTSQDIDGLGHTNNGSYVRFCEHAAWQHSSSLGIGIDDYHRLDRAMIVRSAEYDYLFPSFLENSLIVATWLHEVKGASMKRSFQIIDEKSQTTILRATWRLACIELSTGRAKKCPDEFIGRYVET